MHKVVTQVLRACAQVCKILVNGRKTYAGVLREQHYLGEFDPGLGNDERRDARVPSADISILEGGTLQQKGSTSG
jgi:hypothetical protein